MTVLRCALFASNAGPRLLFEEEALAPVAVYLVKELRIV